MRACKLLSFRQGLAIATCLNSLLEEEFKINLGKSSKMIILMVFFYHFCSEQLFLEPDLSLSKIDSRLNPNHHTKLSLYKSVIGIFEGGGRGVHYLNQTYFYIVKKIPKYSKELFISGNLSNVEEFAMGNKKFSS